MTRRFHLVAWILMVAFPVVAICAGAMWRRGWIVAKTDYVQVRKVPIATGYFATPVSAEYSYVIEVGTYPYETTFRVVWDSYEAKEITIRTPTRNEPELLVSFDGLYKVIGRLGGDVQRAYWSSE